MIILYGYTCILHNAKGNSIRIADEMRNSRRRMDLKATKLEKKNGKWDPQERTGNGK